MKYWIQICYLFCGLLYGSRVMCKIILSFNGKEKRSIIKTQNLVCKAQRCPFPNRQVSGYENTCWSKLSLAYLYINTWSKNFEAFLSKICERRCVRFGIIKVYMEKMCSMKTHISRMKSQMYLNKRNLKIIFNNRNCDYTLLWQISRLDLAKSSQHSNKKRPKKYQTMLFPAFCFRGSRLLCTWWRKACPFETGRADLFYLWCVKKFSIYLIVLQAPVSLFIVIL